MHPSSLFNLLCVASVTVADGRQGQHDQRPLGAVEASSSSRAPPYRDALLELHRSLVSIPSISGAESDVGNSLAQYLRSLGYNVERQFLPQPGLHSTIVPDAGKRFNIVASRPASETAGISHVSSRPRILVTSHIDVVPPYIPYSISDAKSPSPDTVIRGRGSVDAKASVVAQIVALEELRRAGVVQGHEVMLLFVVGEETTGDGMRFFSKVAAKDGLAFDAGIFGEPTENKLACGHKGHAACDVRATGKAGHSGYPWLGKSATEVLLRALVKVLDTELGGSERFGNTTVNIGLIEGGVAANVIPEHASARIALRIAAGDQETGWDIVKARLVSIVEEVDSEALSLECANGYGPIECICDVEGFESIVVNYGTDVANLEGNHARYLYGPGSILVAHGDDEGLQVRDLEAAVEGYKALIRHALKN